MTEWQIVALCAVFAVAGIVAGIRFVRWLYLHEMDSLQGKLFDKLMSPLRRIGDVPEGDGGDVSIMSGPKPRFRF